MTWLSRLLPQSPSLRRFSDHSRRTRQAQRRRMATLDSLEDRTLLSNVVTSLIKAADGSFTLAIAADVFSDTFTVTENPTGFVTVTGTAKTTINGSHSPYTTN